MIKLNDYKKEIITFINQGETEFITENNSIKTIGVYANPLNGWISLNFNKETNLDQSEKNCPDYEYVEYKMLEVNDWEEEYNNNPIKISDHQNRIIEMDEDVGDDEFNEPFFNFLKHIIHKLSPEMKAEEIFIQILDSQYQEQIK